MWAWWVRLRQFLVGGFCGLAAAYLINSHAPEILRADWFLVVCAVPVAIAEFFGANRVMAIFWGIAISLALVWAALLEFSQRLGDSILGLSLEDLSHIASIFGVFVFGSINAVVGVLQFRRSRQDGPAHMRKSTSSGSSHQHQQNTASDNAIQININNNAPPERGEKQFKAPSDPLAGLRDGMGSKLPGRSEASEREGAGRTPRAGRRGIGGAG